MYVTFIGYSAEGKCNFEGADEIQPEMVKDVVVGLLKHPECPSVRVTAVADGTCLYDTADVEHQTKN